eukprot:Phypoly_transcript_25496.p1 GENE.Phypoly_transcript_25496~~Phypoly_transcript_25496.p1  ORF type:complete len:110 (+),score=20.12 Phypoly_transcript_25496:167-496(+)
MMPSIQVKANGYSQAKVKIPSKPHSAEDTPATYGGEEKWGIEHTINTAVAELEHTQNNAWKQEVQANSGPLKTTYTLTKTSKQPQTPQTPQTLTNYTLLKHLNSHTKFQ